MSMYVSNEVAGIINRSFSLAKNAHFEYVTPELVLYVICQNRAFGRAFAGCGGDRKRLDRDLRDYLEKYMEPVADEEREPELSQGAGQLFAYAWETAQNGDRSMVELPHVIAALYGLAESHAVYYMRVQGVERADLLQELAIVCEEIDREESKGGRRGGSVPGEKAGESGRNGTGRRRGVDWQEEDESGDAWQEEEDWEEAASDSNGRKSKGGAWGDDGFEEDWEETAPDSGGKSKGGAWGDDGFEEDWEEAVSDSNGRKSRARKKDNFWRDYAVCLNEEADMVNPLIGREAELERTMQILCRREKNNPLHIGEPGVGKTAITYGLARLLNEGRVPAALAGAEIFALDLGSLLAGTQYRGDFEKRFKRVMDSLACQEKPIIYIDEIHNIVGAGAVNGGTFDISNMLKPYLAQGHIRFIGATTYEEYKKHFEKSKSLVRRFRNIDIKEPDIPDAVQILKGLQETYESFHGVRYEEGVLEYAVEMSAKYIRERFLPDKAIDLIDEAGAYRRLHPVGAGWEPADGGNADGCHPAQNPQTAPAEGNTDLQGHGSSAGEAPVESVDRDLIDEILSKTCHIPRQAMEGEETAALATLEERLKKRIFGQDEAVSQVVNAVKFSRAGLLEEGKPLASLLFVGPTGVGKTEIARSLAEELGIRLIRFDMSEYEEKHAVAKLIGAPAGYVGYEEGGLLTEEIRRNPHAVLLLDEIEKAHPDIYNILLQAMDYATLTDNQGRKADFRNVIIVMTSNAGASRIGTHGIGFQGQDRDDSVIMEEVKRIFQPEFRNRLNRIVVFRGMDERMAGQIVDKKLGELEKMLLRKNVYLSVDAQARELVRRKGISAQYGAREIERVIQGEIKPLLVDEILFGALKEGGHVSLTVLEDRFRIVLSGDESMQGV